MDFGHLSSLVALITALSVASERLMEIVKNVFEVWYPTLQKKENPTKDEQRWRSIKLHLCAFVAGCTTALLARPIITGISPAWATPLGIIGLGFLTSGGSGFWNSVVSYLSAVKDVKKIDAGVMKLEAEVKSLDVQERMLKVKLLQEAKDRPQTLAEVHEFRVQL